LRVAATTSMGRASRAARMVLVPSHLPAAASATSDAPDWPGPNLPTAAETDEGAAPTTRARSRRSSTEAGAGDGPTPVRAEGGASGECATSSSCGRGPRRRTKDPVHNP
jgi:hypothetical protein